jgi:radical SAM protein with 4Fe4S-binding SPASM domain
MGEPLLCEDSLAYLSYLSAAGIQVKVDTNGHCFRDRDFADRLIQTNPAELNIAFDGTDQATLAAIRGQRANFDLLVSGIKLVVQAKERLESAVRINLQFIVSRPNEHQIEEVCELGRSLHPDSMTFKLIRLDPKDERACTTLMPSVPAYREYDMDTAGSWHLKGALLSECWAVRSYCSVWWDGTLVPCCFDLDGTHAYGNVFDTSFREAWNSDVAFAFREAVATDLRSVAMCEICPVARDQDNCWKLDFSE